MLSNQFVCVACGTPAKALYKQLSSDVLMLLHCSGCGLVVDKYIEYDAPIIAIDVILQQHEAYRHILFNAGPKPFWKLAVVLLLCDAYTLWSRRRSTKSHQYDFPIQPEWDFYSMSFVAVIEACAFVAVVQGMIALLKRWKKITPIAGTTKIVHALIIGGCGKLLALPAFVWETQDSIVYLVLVTIFIALSQMHVLEAIANMTRLASIITVTLGLCVQYVVRTILLTII